MTASWLLALESASERAGAALLRGEEPVAACLVEAGRPASEGLLPAVLALLAEHALAPSAVSRIAVSIGPGSFTGLRVGVATAKGLAFGAPGAVVGVPTLGALAALGTAREPAPRVVATLDARRGELYAACHHGDDPLAAPLWGPEVIATDALATRLAAEPEEVLVVGEGAAELADRVGGTAAGRLRWLGPPAGVPDATWVGRLGARLFAAGAGLAPADLAPVYVRRAEAEVRRTGVRFEPP